MTSCAHSNSPGSKESAEAADKVIHVEFQPKDPRIRHALELMREPRVTIAQIAAALNLSTSRFRHLFKNETNDSPTHYLKLARLVQAKALIEGSFLTVKEVAAFVGFNDVSHFVRDYKSQYGQTPSESRHVKVRNKVLLQDVAASANK